MFNIEQANRGWGLHESWLIIARLLLTCEVWDAQGGWRPHLGHPVFRERNDYKLTKRGVPNKALREAIRIGDYIALQFGIPRLDLCANIGIFLRALAIQPNNPRGHAFRSLAANVLAVFGDQGLDISEEVAPQALFPGWPFHLRSERPRIDIVVKRQGRVVAMTSARWTYRHDRVELLDEAAQYLPAGRYHNPHCRFFGVVAEVSASRLRKVVSKSGAVQPHAALERLVHLHRALPTTVIGHNGTLSGLWDLTDWVQDSFNWQ